MITSKNILVTTTPTIGNLNISQYIKPISAHVVAGTNLFSDFFASFSDVFGGRSQSYQKQLSSLYNEAIEQLKANAHEIGANCIVGLHVDLDEISGKGKSMFMVTAIGTAVIINDIDQIKQEFNPTEKFENVGLDRINILKRKRELLEKAGSGELALNDEVWDFISQNQVSELFDFVLTQIRKNIAFAETRDSYYQKTATFLNSLPDDKKTNLLYKSIIQEENEALALKLCTLIEELKLLDFEYLNEIFNLKDFQKQKRGLRIVTYDKSYYNKQDLESLQQISDYIKITFPELGVRSMKKQLLSSKEKEVWTCECKNVIEIGKYCGNCKKDIYGFLTTEISPPIALSCIEEKISLISEHIK